MKRTIYKASNHEKTTENWPIWQLVKNTFYSLVDKFNAMPIQFKLDDWTKKIGKYNAQIKNKDLALSTTE
jgi:hypothetical protein